ncbi:hypothetical protein QYM36_010130, partial [Artemia franciscana]
MDEMASGDESITATNSSGSSASAKAPVQPVAPTKYSGLTPKPLVDTRNQSYMPPPTQAAALSSISESLRSGLSSSSNSDKSSDSYSDDFPGEDQGANATSKDMAGPKRGRGDKASAQAPEKVEGEPEIKVLKSEEDVKEETPKEEQISSETDQGKPNISKGSFVHYITVFASDVIDVEHIPKAKDGRLLKRNMKSQGYTSPNEGTLVNTNDLVKEDFGNMDESVAALPKNKHINNDDIDHVATPGSSRSIFWNCRGLMSKKDFLSAFLPSHDILLIGPKGSKDQSVCISLVGKEALLVI